MLQLHGTEVEVSREGVQTMSVVFYATDWASIDDVPASFSGLGGKRVDLVKLSAKQAEEGLQYVTTATYEGMAQDKFVNKVYSWRRDIAKDAIESNPNFWDIVKRYNGYEREPGSGIFDAWPDIKSKRGGTTKNPMVGVDSFYNVGGSWNEVEVVDRIPDDLWKDMWRIVDHVPGNALPTLQNRLWLTLPPEIDQRGACFSLTRSWMLTGEMDAEKLNLSRMIYSPVSG